MSYHTHLDRLMTELGIENHQLAENAGTSRQAIHKLRRGITRMLPDWAKRLSPHLGVSWQELVDGTPTAADQSRAELLSAYDALTEEQRQALLTMANLLVSAANTGASKPDPPAKLEPPRRRGAA
jgi:plasmid maintenance system antidote protein VapI